MKNIISIVKSTPTLISIFLGASILIFQYFEGYLPQEVQITFFLVLILTTGIPHGALDHLIQKQTYFRQKNQFSFAMFLVKYLSIMFIYGLLWYFFSGFSFLFFILISAWHFGETDIAGVPPSNVLWRIVRIIYGLYIIAFILLIHHQEASPIVKQMLVNYPDGINLWETITVNVKVILYLIGLFLITIFIVAQSESFTLFDKFRFFRLALILIISIWLPLIPAFALYFGGWHALCAFDNLYDFLKKDYPTISFKSIYLKAMPFTILAIVFLVAFFWFCQKYTNHIDPFAILFIFISLITLPHLIVTNAMTQQ